MKFLTKGRGRAVFQSVSAWLCTRWGPRNCFYWLEQQKTRSSARLSETQVTTLLPGIYDPRFSWLFWKSRLQNMMSLEEVEWEVCYSVMFKLFDLVFKSLRSGAHLRFVVLLLLIIISSPSGVLLCPKRRVLLGMNNVTWQRAAWTDSAVSRLSAQGRALRLCWRCMWISGGADAFCPGRPLVQHVSWYLNIGVKHSAWSNQWLYFSWSELCVQGRTWHSWAVGHTWALLP